LIQINAIQERLDRGFARPQAKIGKTPWQGYDLTKTVINVNAHGRLKNILYCGELADFNSYGRSVRLKTPYYGNPELRVTSRSLPHAMLRVVLLQLAGLLVCRNSKIQKTIIK